MFLRQHAPFRFFSFVAQTMLTGKQSQNSNLADDEKFLDVMNFSFYPGAVRFASFGSFCAGRASS
jgi:hypothetical protein